MCYVCGHELCSECEHVNDGEHRCCQCGAAVIFPQNVVCCDQRGLDHYGRTRGERLRNALGYD